MSDAKLLPAPPRADKTDSERRFEEKRRKRAEEQARKEGTKSYKQRLEQFNKHLGSLSEHYDIPKVGPG
jgi:protein FAM32A